MKILHFSDPHGNKGPLSRVREEVIDKINPDLVIVSGDWIDGVFSDEELKNDYWPVFKALGESKEEFLEYVIEQAQQDKEATKKIVSPELFQRILNGEILDDDETAINDRMYLRSLKDIHFAAKAQRFLDAAEAYPKFVEKGEESMLKQYEEMKEIMKDVLFLTVPGNHDGPCLEKVMSEEYLHLKAREINGIKIAGYGGATMYPMTIPLQLLVKFKEQINSIDEEKGEVNFASEAYKFFEKEDPQIIVTHEMPKGLVDGGSLPLRFYIKKEKPYIVFAGHYHGHAKVFRLGDEEFSSYVILPGCLGKYSTYAEVTLRDEGEEEERLLPELIRIKSLDGGVSIEYNPRKTNIPSAGVDL